MFNVFKSAYATAGWKIVNKPDWIEVSSTKGIPVVIYCQ